MSIKVSKHRIIRRSTEFRALKRWNVWSVKNGEEEEVENLQVDWWMELIGKCRPLPDRSFKFFFSYFGKAGNCFCKRTKNYTDFFAILEAWKSADRRFWTTKWSLIPGLWGSGIIVNFAEPKIKYCLSNLLHNQCLLVSPIPKTGIPFL